MTEGTVPTEAAALTRHIETFFHALNKERLPMLAAMAERVKIVHVSDEGVPEGLSGLHRGLAEFIDGLTEHMRLENDVLFPQSEPANG